MGFEDAALNRVIATLKRLHDQASGSPSPDSNPLLANAAALAQAIADAQSLQASHVRFARLKVLMDLAQEVGGVGAYEYNLKTGALWWSASVRALYRMDDISTPSLEQWLAAVHPDDRERVAATAEGAIRDGLPVNQTYRIVLPEGGVKWIEDRGKRITSDDGSSDIVIGLNIDITELREAQEQREFLMQELGHRVKNTITIVHAVVQRTLQRDKVEISTRRALEERIIAIARAHDILIRNHGQGGMIDDITSGVLDHQRDHISRIQMTGPSVHIGPQGTLALSMVLHELCTNAVKYGSLSNANGSIHLTWSVDSRGNAEVIFLEWREVNGPNISTPKHEGFGSRMIRQAFSFDAQATIHTEFNEQGLICRFSFNLAQ